MKVRSLLLISLSAAMVLMCVLFYAAWSAASELRRQASIQSHASEIGGQVSTLLVLTHEYALHGEARVVEQWRTTHKKIIQGLEVSLSSDDPAPAEALEQAGVLSAFFDQLVSPLRKGDSALEERRTRLLINQMLSQTQTFFDKIEHWGYAASVSRQQLEERITFLFYTRTIAMMVILVMLVILMWHRVLRPLRSLHATVRALTNGNLDARCSVHTADEFGDLSRSFDMMAEARQKSDAALRESKNFMILLIDVIPGIVGYWTNELICTFANRHYQTWFDKSKEEMVGIRMQDLLGEELFRVNEPYIRAVLRGEPQQFERSIIKPDGTVVYTLAHFVPDRDGDHVKGFFVMVSDITQLKLAEVASEQFAINTFNSVNEHLCVLNGAGEILKVNRAWRDFYEKMNSDNTCALLGVGTNYLDACDLETGPYREDGKLVAEGIRHVIGGGATVFSLECSCTSRNEKRWFMVTVTRFDGDASYVVVAHQDITERKLAEIELEKWAQIDALTGLANRRYFLAQAEQELLRNRRYGGKLSVLMMDLDNFKAINDVHGHKVGDLVLIRVGEVCREVLRHVDIAGRIGGEEFAIILPETDGQVALDVAERLREAIASAHIPLENGATLLVTASIGIAELAAGDALFDSILHRADKALYEAKHSGRNKVRVGSDPLGQFLLNG